MPVMRASDSDPVDEPAKTEASNAKGFGRAAKAAVIFFLLLLIVLILVSWLGGDSSMHPLDYDGFD